MSTFPDQTRIDGSTSSEEAGDTSDRAFVHGVAFEDGQPVRAPRTWADLRECVLSTFRVGDRGDERSAEVDGPRGQPPADVDPDDLESAGWGVLVASDADSDVLGALDRLLRHREDQAGRRFRRFDGADGLQPGQTVDAWLESHHVTPDGPTDPDRVPYYLMVVGTPQEIPFSVDFDLGRQLAVGRLGFSSLQEYQHYADTVVDAEVAPAMERRWLTFAPTHAHDGATTGSRAKLVQPILDSHGALDGWMHASILDGAATKDELMAALHDAPSLLFFAGHGLGSAGKAEKLDRIGALLCADWPGPRGWKGPIPPEHYVAASDLADIEDLRGMITVLFGCHTAGQPRYDSFCLEPPRELAPEDRISALAAEMLGRERGARAVLGHLDRGWSFSYSWRGLEQPRTFQSVFTDLVRGRRVGYAFRHLGERYHLLAVRSARLFQQLARGGEVDERGLVDLFVSEVDAQSWLLLGDPAVAVTSDGVDNQA